MWREWISINAIEADSDLDIVTPPGIEEYQFSCSNCDPHTGQEFLIAWAVAESRNVTIACERGLSLSWASDPPGGGLIDFFRLTSCTYNELVELETAKVDEIGNPVHEEWLSRSRQALRVRCSRSCC